VLCSWFQLWAESPNVVGFRSLEVGMSQTSDSYWSQNLVLPIIYSKKCPHPLKNFLWATNTGVTNPAPAKLCWTVALQDRVWTTRRFDVYLTSAISWVVLGQNKQPCINSPNSGGNQRQLDSWWHTRGWHTQTVMPAVFMSDP